MAVLILGIDDAGRGPLIGPMILAGVLVNKAQEIYLKNKKIRDSKDVSQNERLRLRLFIENHSLIRKIVKSFPNEIDSVLEGIGENLNTLEARKTAEIINAINSGKYIKERIRVIVDCPSVNTISWRNTLLSFIEHKDNLEIFCEHKADVNYVVVGAASILAKLTREKEVSKIKKEFGNTGSGYPADPRTKKFLVEHGEELKDSGIFRKSWSTWKKMFPGRKQGTLEGF